MPAAANSATAIAILSFRVAYLKRAKKGTLVWRASTMAASIVFCVCKLKLKINFVNLLSCELKSDDERITKT